ncbi:MAG: hypothetical protein CL609_09315 [Anaerolineaceae bacterium]|nr:hypothetical protein [Anaerolineaceae bacterium]
MEELSRIKNRISQFIKQLDLKPYRKFSIIFFYILGFLLLAFLVIYNWKALIDVVKNVNIIWLLSIIFCYPLGMLPTVAVWHEILKSTSNNIKFRDNFLYYCLSIFSKHIPGFVFFIGNRSIVYSEKGISTKKILFLTMFETIILSLVGYFISIPLVIFNNQLIQFKLKVLILVFCSIALLLVFFLLINSVRKKPNREIRIFNKEFYLPTINIKPLIFAVLYSILAWIGGGLLLSFMVISLDIFTFSNILFSIGVYAFVGSLSMTLGLLIQGFGIRELTMVLLFSAILSPVKSMAISIGFRVLLTIGEVLWITLFVIILKPKKLKESREGNIS